MADMGVQADTYQTNKNTNIEKAFLPQAIKCCTGQQAWVCKQTLNQLNYIYKNNV